MSTSSSPSPGSKYVGAQSVFRSSTALASFDGTQLNIASLHFVVLSFVTFVNFLLHRSETDDSHCNLSFIPFRFKRDTSEYGSSLAEISLSYWPELEIWLEPTQPGLSSICNLLDKRA
ncbi:hypothetical protein O6H91_02G102900 [Diphasiastrum complanatum]|uniref:Uncharacterized protein n=1 Tax=Diphasiastrum complanatum TaxID=34168 RepID=A0ACC2EJ19_DIPCM|nr:hypothetical protein O6H91_02G102900 [Diphasiastrum complanatum]